MLSEKDRFYYQLIRWLYLPRDKKERIRKRYERWLLYKLTKYGPGEQVPYEEDLARRKEQAAIRWQNQKFQMEHHN